MKKPKQVHKKMVRGNVPTITLIIVLIAIFAVSGYLVGSRTTTRLSLDPSVVKATPPTNSMFQSQNALLQGKIAQISGNKITVINNNSQSDQFSLSQKLKIYTFKPNSTQASISSDVKSIDKKLPAVILLELIDGNYQVISISYPLPVPPPSSKQ